MNFSNLEFVLYICPKCGLITMHDGICKYCTTQLVNTNYTVENMFGNNICVLDLLKQYYKKELYDKKAWKQREKLDNNIVVRQNKIVWEQCLKKPMKICPKCGYMTHNQYLDKNNTCILCHTEYVETKISAFDYYNPEIAGEGYIHNKVVKAIQTLCIQSSLYDAQLYNKRESEKALEQQVFRPQLEHKSEIPQGFLLSMFEMPSKIKTANNKLAELMLYYTPLIRSLLQEIDNSSIEMTDGFVSVLLSTINHFQNILRGQRFLGQEKNVNFACLFLIEILQSLGIGPHETKI